jgi:glycosyltransferase involved in cell wall biosynthesis
LLNQIIVSSKKLISKDLREREKHRNSWLVPAGHLLGFPMSAAEAAWLGTGVIGFAMGGGLEWMSQETCFLARDRDEDSLLNSIEEVLNTPTTKLQEKIDNARLSVSRFTKEHTWNQIQQSLNITL